MRLRVGIDVGGTFTKAVAVEPRTLEIVAAASVPTTHTAESGVAEGVVTALESLLAELEDRADEIGLVAFSTTQAMNALLEGDVAKVGVVGIGTAPELRVARKRTRPGTIALAPGRSLETEHEFLDATRGLSAEVIDAALGRLEARGCTAIAVSGAFAVDAPEQEDLVLARAAERGLPACAGHDLTGVYGLEMRTTSAAINASVLPVVDRTARHVEQALERAGLDVPLLVLRGDGGAMSIEGFRAQPALTLGSAPAAGVAAVLHELGVQEAIVVECGGTSTNVSVIKGGRPVLRSLKVMGRPTCVRAVDSWVVGVAGGSMARLGRRGIADVGPRSAHIAGVRYACFATQHEVAPALLETVAPRPGDPSYAFVASGSERLAVTATCAANALGLIPAVSYAAGNQGAALEAFDAIAVQVGGSGEQLARKFLGRAVEMIADTVSDAARQHDLGRDVPLVALGGSGDAFVPQVAEALGRPLLRTPHAEVLSAVGAALSLVRTEIARTAGAGADVATIAREAELACVEAGAAPATVYVETSFDPRESVLRAVAVGAVALEHGAATAEAADEQAQAGAAAAALGAGPGELQLLCSTDFYSVFRTLDDDVAVVDAHGAVPLAERMRGTIVGSGPSFLAELEQQVEAASRKLGVATLLPRVSLLCGPRLLDLSDSRRTDEMLTIAERALDGHDGMAVALVTA